MGHRTMSRLLLDLAWHRQAMEGNAGHHLIIYAIIFWPFGDSPTVLDSRACFTVIQNSTLKQ